MDVSKEMAGASGLLSADAETVRELVAEWDSHRCRNRLRDEYYLGRVKMKDLGVSVSKELAAKLDPHIDWAAKCVDWWADRVRFEGVSAASEDDEDALRSVFAANDMKNTVHKAASCALRHGCSFMAVTSGDEASGEPKTVVSAFPATAAAALYDEARKRIRAGLVVVATAKKYPHQASSTERVPSLAYVMDDDKLIVLARDTPASWTAEYRPHGMGRVPMEPIAYHATLERPFGRSRITRAVMSLVDDAQRAMANMAACAAFNAAPQKFLLGADAATARKLAESTFGAYVGSLFAATDNRAGKTPQFGQLPQVSMQPHVDYMRSLAAQFSGTTGVPLSSLGVVTDNPSSAEAIYAGKEDAVVDIQSFVDAVKRSIGAVASMALANERGVSLSEVSADLSVNFANPAMPSVVSQSDAMVKQISAIPWLASSDVALRELGYTEEQIVQLRSDRRKAQAIMGADSFLSPKQAVGDADNAG